VSPKKNKKVSNPVPPGGNRRLLLHSCCAPCAGGILESLLESGVEATLFFCNPNIHPHDEYRKRKEEQKTFADKRGVPFVEADPDPAPWFRIVAGLEDEPERGRRCTACFLLRLTTTAEYAAAHGFEIFATTLGISRWKDLDQVNAAGQAAAGAHAGTAFWPFNWRKGGGSQRMIEVSKREGFYHQPYCGCVFSLRDTNCWRLQKGDSIIERDLTIYGRWLGK
jgi:predicted adenine nucleotide alpha hydrolase (AANH) superfamily ATPase